MRSKSPPPKIDEKDAIELEQINYIEPEENSFEVEDFLIEKQTFSERHRGLVKNELIKN